MDPIETGSKWLRSTLYCMMGLPETEEGREGTHVTCISEDPGKKDLCLLNKTLNTGNFWSKTEQVFLNHSGSGNSSSVLSKSRCELSDTSKDL